MAMRRNYRRRRGRSGIAGLVLFLLVAVVAGVVLAGTVFVVKTINVVGNVSIPSEDIVTQSGVKLGESIFKIHVEDVKRQFDGIGRLGVEGIETTYPSTITIQVRERVKRVLVNYAGLPTVLDEYGYAIEQSREMPTGDLPVVTGLRASACQVGRKIVSDIIGQVESMNKVVTQLYQQQLQGLISELNVSDLDNMYLMTRSGMMVKIGDADKLSEKLTWMNSVLTQLTANGETTGILDVAGGSSATYQPPSDAQQPQP